MTSEVSPTTLPDEEVKLKNQEQLLSGAGESESGDKIIQDDSSFLKHSNLSNAQPLIVNGDGAATNDSIPTETTQLDTKTTNPPEAENGEIQGNNINEIERNKELNISTNSDSKDSDKELNSLEGSEASTTDETKDSKTEQVKEEHEWILVLGHDKLKKKVIKEGQGFSTRPQHGQMVTLSYSARLEDGKEVEKLDRHTIALGDGDVTQALDMCICLMELGEIAEIITEAQYAYGSKGKEPNIPPDSKLFYTVELLDVEEEPDFASMPIPHRVLEADRKRERGNSFYSRGEYSAAINAYTKALQVVNDINETHSADAAQLQSMIDTRMKCYNNLAASQLKVDAWDAALKSTEEVLKIQPENVKALFRKGKCLSGNGDTEGAITVLRKALKLEPELKIIHQELSKLVAKQKSQDASARQMYQKMLGTDKASAAKKKDQNSHWWMYAGGATLAACLSIGIAAYRYLHIQ